jgi:hypothetical protein
MPWGPRHSPPRDPWYVPHEEGQPASVPSVTSPAPTNIASAPQQTQIVPYSEDRFAAWCEAQRRAFRETLPRLWHQRPIAPWAQPKALAAPVLGQPLAPFAAAIGPLATTPPSASALVAKVRAAAAYARQVPMDNADAASVAGSDGSFIQCPATALEESPFVHADEPLEELPDFGSPSPAEEDPPQQPAAVEDDAHSIGAATAASF